MIKRKIIELENASITAKPLQGLKRDGSDGAPGSKGASITAKPLQGLKQERTESLGDLDI